MKRLIYASLFILVLTNCKKETQIISQLKVSADTLIFYGNESKSLTISIEPNSDCGYEIVSHPEWIELYPISGELSGDDKIIYINSVFKSNLPCVYEDNIVIRSTYGDKIVFVKGIINEKSNYSLPDSLRFYLLTNTEDLVLKNEGNISIAYSASTSNEYISLSSTTGNISVGQQCNIKVVLNRDNLLTGRYFSDIYFTINGKIDTVGVRIENFNEQKIYINKNVIDAEYSKVNDFLVYVTSSPSMIYIYNTLTENNDSINLDYIPTCVSISANGENAVIGHDGHLTFVDLYNKTILKSFSISTKAFDIVLGNNKWAYIFSNSWTDTHIRCVNLNLNSDNELSINSDPIVTNTAKMHPSGKYIYGGRISNPTTISKYDIQSDTAKYLYSYEEVRSSNFSIFDIWFTEEGDRLISNNGFIYNIYGLQNQDILYYSNLAVQYPISWLEHSKVNNSLYILHRENFYQYKNASYVYVYNSNSLDYRIMYQLEGYLVSDNNGYFNNAVPHFVFCNSQGNCLFVLTNPYREDWVNKWAVQKIKL